MVTEFSFEIPKQRVLTSNRRQHWRAKADAVRLARGHAAALWDSRRRKGHQPLTSAHCTAYLTFPDRRRRDANNYEPTIKPLIDGLVSGPPKATGWVGLLPDDSSDYLLGPDMRISPEVDPNLRALGIGVRVRLVFTERDDK